MFDRKKKFDEDMVELKAEMTTALMEVSDVNNFRDVIESVRDLDERVSQYEKDKIKMEAEDMMILGFRNDYKLFEEVNTVFKPLRDLWYAAHDFLYQKKEWNKTKMRDISHEEVQNLIDSNFRTVRKLKFKEETP